MYFAEHSSGAMALLLAVIEGVLTLASDECPKASATCPSYSISERHLEGRKNEIHEKEGRNTASMCKLKRLSIVFIALISFPGPAFSQQPPSQSAAPATKLVPPAHGKIPVAFIIGRGAET